MLSSAAAIILLAPLRGAFDGLPLIPFAATIVLFATPGLLFSRWFLGEHFSGVMLVPVGFIISVGAFCLLGVPFLMAHLGIEAYLWSAGAILSVFLAGAAWRVFHVKTLAKEKKHIPDSASAGWLWVPFLFLSGGLAFGGTKRVPTNYDDIWVYLSWVREFAGSERLALREPYFSDGISGLSRAHVNGWLVEQAALSRVSGIDPIGMVLDYLTPTLVIVALLAVYALARTLFEDESMAVLCGLVFALFHIVFIAPSTNNIGVELVARIPEDKHAARFLILPVALLFAILYIESRRLRHLGVFAFFCWAVISVHPIVLPDIGLCMLGFGLIHVAMNPRRKEAWTGMAALALALWSVALGPLLLLLTGRSPTSVLFAADINATPPKVLANMVFVIKEWRHIHEFDDGSYMMHPWLILNPVILAAYVIGVPFLLSRIKGSLAAQLLLGGLVLTTIVVYVPPVATFVGENLIGPGLLWRIAWPIPLLALLTVGWMAWEGSQYAKSRLSGMNLLGGSRRALPLALAVTVALALGLSFAAVALPSSVAKAVELYNKYEEEGGSGYHPDPIYPWLQKNISEQVVLLAPDEASIAIPAYSDSVDVVSLRGGPIIRDREALERSAGSRIKIPQRALDVHRFFSGASQGERCKILRRYDTDYLMVPANGPLDEQLQSEPPGFSSVDAPKQMYSLYRVDPGKLNCDAQAR